MILRLKTKKVKQIPIIMGIQFPLLRQVNSHYCGFCFVFPINLLILFTTTKVFDKISLIILFGGIFMNYTSTRDNSLCVSSSVAIASGISADGGLFVPCDIPHIDAGFTASLVDMDYIHRARSVLKLFLTDYSNEEIEKYTEGAYGTGFSSDAVAPTVPVGDKLNILELWHGPTCAFKDMALQLLPYLLTGAAKRTAGGKEIVILVATSGDTGKAALEGFKDVDGTRILVFYPEDGVSPMQKLQMASQLGKNVGVCAIYGNFDDAQTGVKKIFTDNAVKEKLAANNMAFSSANSINWGRLVPQIVYYFSAYADMIKLGKIKNGDKINITVPTGNFGNILAAYYAKEMGLPVNKLICASNANNVLTEFLETGHYNRNRPFYTTVSPSMDILISSNLERLLYHLSGNDSEIVRSLYSCLAKTGEFTVGRDILDKIKELFGAGCCDDTATKETISYVFKENNYLCDTHTAVAVNVYLDYLKKTGDNTPNVIASTASPYKFSKAVLEAVAGRDALTDDDFAMVDKLKEITGVSAPVQLKSLKGAEVRFKKTVKKEDMEAAVYELLNIR